MTGQKIFRCAIYTRKSSEEGLEQDFNSLEAQREACEAYVRSQAHEGWKLILDRFDDGGFSGGNMDRPALASLMDRVREGKVDVIVIYKIDRLTRSLTDFARLAETFDKHGVSFVSVTQQFNTTTSMGRLMLNVLLSFAQFEREITGERIRDKIAASKKKGMWMGGNVPMGYDVKDRQLIISEGDAQTIRRVFDLYLEEGSVPALLDRLGRDQSRTARRVSSKGLTSGGRPFTRGHLYKLLSNPIYVGRVPHKEISHRGQHEAIIDKAMWDKVQAKLADNTQGPRSRRARAAERIALLSGLLVTDTGAPFLHSHAAKGARRYRYYVSQPKTTKDPSGSSPEPIVRLPATEIERAVLDALRTFLADQRRLRQELGELLPEEVGLLGERANDLVVRLDRPGKAMADEFRQLVVKVLWRRSSVTLELNAGRLCHALGLSSLSDGDSRSNSSGQKIALTSPLAVRRRGPQMKLVTVSHQPQAVDRTLVTAIARARDWADRLISGEASTVTEIGEAEGVTDGYVGRVLALAFIGPQTIERILAGSGTTAASTNEVLWRSVPSSWADQEQSLATLLAGL